MATNTPRLGLRQPATTDQVNVDTDLAENFDKVDDAIGLFPCTSASRPATPYNGMTIYETDTGKAYGRLNGAWVQLVLGGVQVDADLQLAAANKLKIGTDVELRRASANVLQIPDTVDVGGALLVGGSLDANGDLSGRFGNFSQSVSAVRVLADNDVTADEFRSPGNGNAMNFMVQSGPGGGLFRCFWNGTNIQFVRNDTNLVVKTFVIEHPLDDTRYLVHATTESPHNGVEYWGVATVRQGAVDVQLPPYFESLTSTEGRSVLLTPVAPDVHRKRPKSGRQDPVRDADQAKIVRRQMPDGDDRSSGKDYEEFVSAPITPDRHDLVPDVAATYPHDGRFRIVADHGAPDSFEVNWLVKAIRKDVPTLDVEPTKADNVRLGDGPYTYLAPRP